MGLFIIPYKAGSKSAKALAKELGAKVIKPDNRTKHRFSFKNIYINWGNCEANHSIRVANRKGAYIFNHPNTSYLILKNKLHCFETLKYNDISIPEFTSDKSEADKWLKNNETVVVRHTLTGHSGEGVEIVGPPNSSVPSAPLYTKYKKKKHEFRIHFCGARNHIIHAQQKARKLDVPDDEVNWKVRNRSNGFIYKQLEDYKSVPNEVMVEALKVGIVLYNHNVTIGAVDIIYNEQENKAYVLEVNLAPGLEGTTVTKYANALREGMGEFT